MERLLKEIREAIKENKGHLKTLPAKDRAGWVLLSVANSSAFREVVPKSEEFLTGKDATLGYIYTVGTLIKRVLKEEGL
jgi:predicted neutral ceramidase superfamily lipid hydrolase